MSRNVGPSKMTMKVGDTVIFAKMPSWVTKMPEDSRRVFETCLGKSFTISEIDRNGLFVLDIGKEVDTQFGGLMNDIRLEAKYLKEK